MMVRVHRKLIIGRDSHVVNRLERLEQDKAGAMKSLSLEEFRHQKSGIENQKQ
jgi:hypothetical protein